MRPSIAAAAVGAALLLVSCATSQPIYNVQNAPVTTNSGKAPQASQVRAAILTAGNSLGWRVADVGPGQLEATLNLRKHTAVVDIPYTATTYSIVLKRTENLDESAGNVHKNYNSWVQNFDRAIRTELSRL